MRKKPSPIKSLSSHRISLLNICLATVFLSIVAVTVVIRIRTLDVPLERDEGEYAYAGQLMLEGIPPYSLVYNMKMPGIYAAYAVILAIFGQTASGIHLAVLIINTATVLLLFFLTKKLFGSIAGVGAAVFFAIMSISSSVQASANAENFVLLPAIGGIILLMKFADCKKYFYIIMGSFLLGIGFMMKQHGAGFILFGFILMLWNQLKEKPINWESTGTRILIYSFFAAVPFLATCLILWYCGVFKNFWFWTFEYAYRYINMVPVEAAYGRLTGAVKTAIKPMRIIWLTGLLGLLSIIWNRETRKQGVFLAGLLVCSFLSLCPGYYFRQHYFVLFLPAVCILAAAGITAIGDLAGKVIKSSAVAGFILILIVSAVWLQSFYSQRDYLMETNPIKISKINFDGNPFSEAERIAEFIKNNSDKDDKIAIFGSEPEIFFYSQRRSATSYIYVYPLTEPHPYAIKMQREMMQQIEETKPKFVVYVKVRYSWLVRTPAGEVFMAWADKYAASNYRQIGLVEIISPTQTLYHWNSFARPVKNDNLIFIGERID